MKKRLILTVCVVLLFAVSAFVMLAQNTVDDRGAANDPLTNPRANACYEGGSLTGKCDLEWKWVCGWGIIRVEKGILARETLSEACQSLMPALLPTYTPRASSSEQVATAAPSPTTKPK